jgi:hypothetical protein
MAAKSDVDIFIRFTTNLDKAMKTIDKQVNGLSKRLGKMREPPFQGWALSIMFAGMAIKNAMNQIWASSTKTFQEIMHSTEGTTTAFDMLQGSITYLGFTVGQALEPIAMWLAPIIQMFADWVSENEGLVRVLFVILSVFGTLSMFVGMSVLSVLGFIRAFSLLLPIAKTVGLVMAGVFSGPLLIGIALAVAAVIGFIAMWRTNFAGIKEFTSALFGGIWNTIKSIFGNIFNIFKGLFTIIKGIFTGDIDAVLDGAKEVFTNFAALVIKIFFGLGAAIINIFIFAMNSVTSTIFNSWKLIFGLIEKAIAMANSFGIAIPGQEKFAKLVNTFERLKQSAQIGYISADAIGSGLGSIDQMLGIKEKDQAYTEAVTNNQYVTNTYNIDASRISSTEDLLKAIQAQQ